MTLSIVCVWVKGNVPFTAEYVYRLRSMVHRRLKRDHEFFCLTDQPEALRSISCIPIRIPSPPPGLPGWWSKLEIFNPRHGLRGPGVYLDLDVLLVNDLDPIADYDADMALVPHDGDFNGRGAQRVVKRYNSSVMRIADLGSRAALYTRWSPAVAARLWGDQDWIGEMLPAEAIMPLEWFPRLSQLSIGVDARPWGEDAKVILCKKPKNHEAVRRYPWFSGAWG